MLASGSRSLRPAKLRPRALAAPASSLCASGAPLTAACLQIHPDGGADRQDVVVPHEVDRGVRDAYAAVRGGIRRNVGVPVHGDPRAREVLRPVELTEWALVEAVDLALDVEEAFGRVRAVADALTHVGVIRTARGIEDPLRATAVRHDQHLVRLVDLDQVAAR